MKAHFKSTVALLSLLPASGLVAQVQQIYSQGSPTADEQYMLELINRARTNPSAEGKRLATSTDENVKFAIQYYKVDLAKLKEDFASYPARPPLAMNAALLAAARKHSTDMAKKNFQSHMGSDGSSEGDRVQDEGYDPSALNESVYSKLVPTPYYAHAGFNIDWGTGSGGNQPGLGHRLNIMNFSGTVFREVGIGLATRTGASADKYGKLSVTQDFANQIRTPSFLTGVAYYDVNRNGICDPGEGLSGINAKPTAGDYYARTSSSGGYAIPFKAPSPANTLTFSGGGLAKAEVKSFSMDGENEKVDLRIVSGAPFVHLEMLDASATEGGEGTSGTAMFRVARVGPLDKPLSVALTRPVEAVAGVAAPKDYKISAVKPAGITGLTATKARFTLVIPKGQRTASVQITAVKDSLREPLETATFRIDPSAAYRTASPSSAPVSIRD